MDYDKIFLLAFVATILFGVSKFIEMKYVNKELKPLKFVVRDIIIVFICSIAASSIILSFDSDISGLLNVVTDNKVVTPAVTQVFTDDPGF